METWLTASRSSPWFAASGVAKPTTFSATSPTEMILLLVMLIVAVGAGSLTLLGETIHSILIMTAAVWPSAVLARAARDAGQHYEFGPGKLEQAGNMAIALALAAGGLWLASRAVGAIMAAQGETEPLGLALAATANALYTIRIGCSLWARPIAGARNEQPIPGVPSPVGIARFATLLFTQTVLTVAALATDPAVALAADGLGAIVVSLLMTTAGARMFWQAVLDVTDHPLQSRSEQAITRLLLEQGVHPEELVDIRTRRSGRDVFIELTMDPREAPSLDDSRRRLTRVRQSLERRFRGLDVSIRLHTPES